MQKKQQKTDKPSNYDTTRQTAVEKPAVMPVYEEIELNEIKDRMELSHNVAYEQVSK